jgi:adenosylcobyric acid synthase
VASRALMVLGTSSGVGKSWLCTGLCRLFHRRGVSVAPFKAINFSSNTAEAEGAPNGLPGEIGRAQAVQAEACGISPTVDMNPVLVKSDGEDEELVLLGRPEGTWKLAAFRGRRERLWSTISSSYDRLASRHELLIIEGAGSPAEINERGRDLANMHMAHHTDARVLLLGDMERGGVFASLFGTYSLLDQADRNRVKGFVINRAGGPDERLTPGVRQLEAMTKVKVRGVIPMVPEILIEPGDSLIFEEPGRSPLLGALDFCAVRWPGEGAAAEVDQLRGEHGVGLRDARTAVGLGNPDLLLLPAPPTDPAFSTFCAQTGLDRGLAAITTRGIPTLTFNGGRWDASPELAVVFSALGFSGPVSLADPRHRRVLLDGLRARRGLDLTSDPLGPLPRSVRHQQYDALADLLESRLNLDGLWD